MSLNIFSMTMWLYEEEASAADIAGKLEAYSGRENCSYIGIAKVPTRYMYMKCNDLEM